MNKTNPQLSDTDKIISSIESLASNVKELTETIKEKKKEKPPIDHRLTLKVEDLDLSVRVLNCLKSENIIYVGDLVQTSPNHLLRIRFLGKDSLEEIKTLLKKMGLKLGMHLSGWNKENIQKTYELLDEDFLSEANEKRKLVELITDKLESLNVTLKDIGRWSWNINRNMEKLSDCTRHEQYREYNNRTFIIKER